MDKKMNIWGDKEFYTKTFAIALPIALQSLITIGVNLLDNIMLGAMGEIQMSASSLAVQYITFFAICCMGLGMGASVLVSRFWGMQDIHSLKKSVTLMIRFTVAIGLVFTLIAALAPKSVMTLFTSEDKVIFYGIKYLRWSIPTFLLMGLTTTCTIVMRSTGQTKVPLIGSCFSFLINVFANWVFIFGHWGAPRMEIEGAALATLISRIFEFCFNCGYFIFIDKKIGYRIKDLALKCRDLLHTYIVISLPVLVSDALLGLGTTVVAMVMGRIGSAFVASNSITAVVQQLSTALIQGLSQAGCIVTGQTLGQGNVKRAKEQSYSFLIFGLLIGTVAGVIIFIIGRPIINMYNIEEETKAIAYQLMYSVGFIVIFQSANSIITKGVLRGGGDTKCLMLADNIFMWIAAIPLGYVTGVVLHMQPFWIYFFLKIDQFLKTFWCIYRLRSGKWIKKIGSSSG